MINEVTVREVWDSLSYGEREMTNSLVYLNREVGEPGLREESCGIGWATGRMM